MTSSRSTLVLFDIDDTLVQTGRAGLRGMNLAFERLHRRANALDGVTFAGRTDRAIVADAFRLMGREAGEADITGLRDAYLEALRAEIVRPVDAAVGVLPGVERVLAALEARPEAFVVGLLTGNFAGGAAIKLGHFDLWRRFPFGAFGDVHVNRRDLVPVALEQARALGCVPATPGDVVVIGDTPLDVDCARAHGARALAVATGPFDAQALAEAGADLTVPTLDDAPDVVEWIRARA
ncbi:MAG: haloacid dehalogenase-like hydrolase [Vicinamibacterales bacterium]